MAKALGVAWEAATGIILTGMGIVASWGADSHRAVIRSTIETRHEVEPQVGPKQP